MEMESHAPSPYALGRMIDSEAMGWRCATSLIAALSLAGCVFGSVRQVLVEPLGPHRDVKSVRVETPDGPSDVGKPLAEGFGRALASRAELQPIGEPAFTLRIELVDVTEPKGDDVAAPRSAPILLSLVTGAAGRLAFRARLLSPSGDEVGRVRWESSGAPSRLARDAGFEAGSALAERFVRRRGDFVRRRAADERMFFTPTELTLEPGELLLTNDELLLFRLGVGLSRRVQMDLWLGALPIPLGGGVAVPFVHAVGAAAGGAIMVLGVFDLGIKVKLLHETEFVPGLSISYDLLDLFGAAFGGGGIALVGGGAVAAAAAGAGVANLQFNLFTLTIGKHFGSAHVTAGMYLLDNHHLLPQSAALTVGTVTSTGGTGGGSGSTPIDMLPLQLQPFLGFEYVLGPHSALVAEFLPRAPSSQSMGSTGIRWLLGFDEPKGPLALDRVRLRLDVAALWFYAPPKESGANGIILPLPWIGVGVYVQ